MLMIPPPLFVLTYKTLKKDELPEPPSHSHLFTVSCILPVYYLFLWLRWVLVETHGIFCCGACYYLFLWLRWVLVETHGVFCCGACYYFFLWLRWVLVETHGVFCCCAWASLVESRELSSCECTGLASVQYVRS